MWTHHLCYLGLSAAVCYMCDAQPVTQSPNYRRAGSAQLELPVTSLPGVSAAWPSNYSRTKTQQTEKSSVTSSAHTGLFKVLHSLLVTLQLPGNLPSPVLLEFKIEFSTGVLDLQSRSSHTFPRSAPLSVNWPFVFIYFFGTRAFPLAGRGPVPTWHQSSFCLTEWFCSGGVQWANWSCAIFSEGSQC